MTATCCQLHLERLQAFRTLQRPVRSSSRELVAAHARRRREWVHDDATLRKDAPGSATSVLTVLEQRGFVNQFTGSHGELSSRLSKGRIGAYVGVDPTAASMHVGHLIPFMALFWLHLHGHRTIALVGGGTASVGDPSGRTQARPHLAKEARHSNAKAIGGQLRRMWENVGVLGAEHGQGVPAEGREDVLILNNEDWLTKANVMEVLNTMGAGLRLGAMLGRDTVKNRMAAETYKNDGMSVAEFCYPLLQAWDWWHMFRHHGVNMQVGGSDQFGNLLSGIDGITYALKLEGDAAARPPPVGLTVPLLTTSSGEKFGKSAGNAVWLDKELTSVFDLYGFFVGTPDSEVEKLLYFFTFVPAEEIASIMQRHSKAPEQRLAQNLLASEFVRLVHGAEEAKAAQAKHSAQKSGKREAKALAGDLQLPLSEVLGQPLANLMQAAGLAETRSKATKLIESGGAYVMDGEGNASKIERGTAAAAHHLITAGLPSAAGEQGQKRFLQMRAGKWKSRTIEVIP